MKTAQEIINEVTQEERRKEIFSKINPLTLQKYSKMEIKIYDTNAKEE